MMTYKAARIRALMIGSAPLVLAIGAVPAAAQTQAVDTPPATIATGSIEAANSGAADQQDIVVTGSRIRRAATDTATPVRVVDQQSITDRGYTSAAEALNNLSSNVPSLNQAAGDGSSAGSGQQFPNLFGLGAGRTLTLMNGRRMVTSSSGLGDAQVDGNIIPVGLIDRIEVVQAGGAVVYGSDAIAGVVNYVLKKDFTGVELDGQAGEASEGRYGTYSARLTAGTNFGGGRGNIALDVEYSETPALRFADRPRSNLSRITANNTCPKPPAAQPAGCDNGDNDGNPTVREVLDAHFWEFNRNGIIYNVPAPVVPLLTRVNGTPVQFDRDGSLISYDPGDALSVPPFAAGGQGFRYSDLAGLRTGVQRVTANLIGHYDITDSIKLSGEFLFAHTLGRETPQGNSYTVLGSAEANSGAIAFTRTNPFLTQATIDALSAASPQFANGGPLFLSKYFYDLTPDNTVLNRTDTYRGVVSLDGDFTALGGRDFYWSASVSHAEVDGSQHGWGVLNDKFNNAIDAASPTVCAINADADPTNDDPACAPINPFGDGNVSPEARAYISARTGQDYVNKQTDFLATLGGELFNLPAGAVKFSAAYEHRAESVRFDPLDATRLGLTGVGLPVEPQSGKYNTDELSGELLIPIIGGDFSLPLVKTFEVNGAFRYVDNSIVGSEKLWSAGVRWEVVSGLTLRGSRSRNFRAPTLTQLFAPSSTGLDSTGWDPCDADHISNGSNPAQRRKACLALFEANPLYGTGGPNADDPASPKPTDSAETRLAHFQDPSENYPYALVTTGGNPALRNEISNTWTFGVVLQPHFVPGLTIVVDRIQVDLKNALVPFTTEDFAAACFDDPNPDPATCNAFTRLSAGTSQSPAGSIATGTTTTFNAGIYRYRGEVYNLNYRFALGGLFGGKDLGNVEIDAEATHTALLTSSVTGATFVRTDNTVEQPDWSGHATLRYSKGPFRASYQINYLSPVLAVPNATVENSAYPFIAANVTHDISAQYDFGTFTLRAGLTNFTNKQPSYPTTCSYPQVPIGGREMRAPSTRSARRVIPLHMTVVPGGGSDARSR
jgi:outer membrane receptor protein involved in Fe transport